jgi:hypothetical protein
MSLSDDSRYAAFRREFPNGVPLRGDLTPAQQAALRPPRHRWAEVTRDLPDDPNVTITATDDPDVVMVTLTETSPA